jgi:hypothetical protein
MTIVQIQTVSFVIFIRDRCYYVMIREFHQETVPLGCVLITQLLGRQMRNKLQTYQTNLLQQQSH